MGKAFKVGVFMVPEGFYTYLWLREDGTPYYVGKGRGYRAYQKSGHTYAPPKDRSRILIQLFPDEDAAFAAEKFLILYYGRLDKGTGCLRNLTDGGDAPPSHLVIWTEEMRKAARGRKAHLGCKHSPETLEKLRQFKLGTKWGHHSEESKARIAVANTGFKHSEEARAKMSAARMGKKPWNTGLKLPFVPHKVSWSEEMREAARQRMLGTKLSECTRYRMSVSHQRRQNANFN